MTTLSSFAAGDHNITAEHLICQEQKAGSLLQDTQYVLDQSQVHSAHGNLHYYIAGMVTSFFPQACNPCKRVT